MLRVFENRILRQIFGTMRVFISVRSRWAGHVARMEEGRSPFKILTGKPTKKITLGRPRCKWKDNIRIIFKVIGINTRDWVDSAQNIGEPL